MTEADVSEDDRAELKRLGWHFDNYEGCWARFT